MKILRLLGPVAVDLDDGKSVSFDGPVEIQILAMLAREPQRAVVAAEALVEVLLAEGENPRDPKKARQSLHTGVHRLRRKAPRVIASTGGSTSSYRLEITSDYEIAKEKRHAAASLLEDEDPRSALIVIDEALGLWRGRPLGGASFRNGVLSEMVEEIDRLYLEFRELRVQASLKARTRLTEALDDLEILLGADPYQDRFHKWRFHATLNHHGKQPALEALARSFAVYREDGLEPDFLEDLRKFASEDTILAHSDDALPREPVQALRHYCLNNLPGATYSEFISTAELDRLKRAIKQQRPIVAVIAIGGRGKRTLVHYFCTEITKTRDHFDVVVWISGKEGRPATLMSVLDQLAITAEQTHLARGDEGEKLHEARKLLQSQRVLVVIEGYDNVTDKDLDRWLTELPHPSKALITTIASRDSLVGYWVEVDLQAPSPELRVPFFKQLLDARPIAGLTPESKVLEELWNDWAGNYKILEWIIGQLPGMDLDELRSQLDGVAGSSVDVVLTKILRTSWDELTDDSRLVLLALACYPHGTERAVLERVAGSPADFPQILRRLQDVRFVKSDGLVDPKFIVDSLVARKVREPGRWQEDEDAPVYDRWLAECCEAAAKVGFCPKDVSRLERFDVPGVRENLEYAIQWAFEHGRYESVTCIGRGMRYYYYVRGLWSPKTDVNQLRAAAARELGDVQEEFDALVYMLNIAAKQGNSERVEMLLTETETILSRSAASLSTVSLASFRHAKALHLSGQSKFREAEELWRKNIELPSVMDPADFNANLRWFGQCLIRHGGEHRAEGRALLIRARDHADDDEHRYPRALMLINLWLAGMDLEGSPTPEIVEETLRRLLTLTADLELLKDLKYEADHHHLLARCYEIIGVPERAVEHREKAYSLYERLGMSPEPDLTRELP